MTELKCKSCEYFEPVSKDFGECRRKAPMYPWPLVLSNAWCGEHSDFKKYLTYVGGSNANTDAE